MLLLLLPAVAAGQPRGTPDIWLVTYGPGEVYWQRFGHNAIWVRDAELGLDHTFNFGFFDFEQEDFFVRFLQGRMLYFSAAQRASDEFSQYINENRSIRAQRLALPPDRALQLADFLVEQVQPQNRDYLYDYYLDNCSTRVRDALDLALGGALRESFETQPAPLHFRDHTRRLTQSAFWLYLGLEIGLGSPVDRPISRWDEFFIPAVLAEGISGLTANGAPLVVEDVLIHETGSPLPPDRPTAVWLRYLLASVGLLAAVAAVVRWAGAGWGRTLARSWLAVTGLVGAALLFFWFGTDHAVAAWNLNLLVFTPFGLLVLGGRKGAPPAAVLTVICALLVPIASLAPPHQYTADVLAAFLPLNLAAAWVVWSRRGA
ncbi:DUF4105 domain-containing protein [Elongatibacter sediminis]|uniref:DUF4105 domain-containing protein n=1 Tax=Elongatibacter sediminis TaxID=3119006 RepID=A0AAW9RG77_9GAMM